MSPKPSKLTHLFRALLQLDAPAPPPPPPTGPTNVAGQALPRFGTTDARPQPVPQAVPLTTVPMTTVEHPDGRMSQYPPVELWDDWVEWDGKAWPQRVARRYMLIPTVCFNCESACGLLAYVDRTSLEIKKFEGNPLHPGSRGRNCAKGPATLNQVYDPERILYPLKRVGARGEGKWERITWAQALEEIGAKMRASRQRRRDGIMYHVGRPGEDGYTNRVIGAWGVDAHNSHTNICSSGARAGYTFWGGFDRPSPDHANARVILLISSHLETGHYFNPHAQRIIEGKMAGAKLITMDPRLSNTASMSDVWLPTWPGSETTVLLAFANHLLQTDCYDREFVRRWVNWEATLAAIGAGHLPLDDAELQAEIAAACAADSADGLDFALFDRALKSLYAPFTFAKAAAEAQVPEARIVASARYIAECEGKLAAHTWRAASIGNLGGWQVARALFFLNVLTGSVGTPGGTAGNEWNKFVPKPHAAPPAFEAWNELQLPLEWPLAHYEMSFLLPHFLEEERGEIDVYFTRVYNPMWINPDGFMWLRALRDENKVKCHIALTPTWNETAWFADYVLPMGHAGERHDLMSQETHAGQWIAFRQPVRRVAMENLGMPVRYTYEANPGEVWEENEFWIELSLHMDPDGSLGIRRWFESPYRPDATLTVAEYYRWIFENSVPGLPAAAAQAGLSPLDYMRKFGAFEITRENYTPFAKEIAAPPLHAHPTQPDTPTAHTTERTGSNGVPDQNGAPGENDAWRVDGDARVWHADKLVGVLVDGVVRAGFDTPSRKLEFYSPTLAAWGWPERDYVIPWPLRSHVHPDAIDRANGEMVLLPNFRLPTLIHTRSANAKWLYEISHKNPIWMHPSDATRLGVITGDLLRVETEIGFFVDSVWVTEAIKPGILAVSHHLGRWRLDVAQGVSRGMSNLATLREDGHGRHELTLDPGDAHATKAWQSYDPDTSRIWWSDVGVHQNLTHAVHPDPVSGAHCWLQKAVNVRKAQPGENHGDVWVNVEQSMAVYRRWLALARPAPQVSPDGTRRPGWLKRPLKPTPASYRLPTPQPIPHPSTQDGD
ncbi:MAG: molybdopterin-dependent oxidoreductase [Litorilinea sp.]